VSGNIELGLWTRDLDNKFWLSEVILIWGVWGRGQRGEEEEEEVESSIWFSKCCNVEFLFDIVVV
jgi:hypothetical protein